MATLHISPNQVTNCSSFSVHPCLLMITIALDTIILLFITERPSRCLAALQNVFNLEIILLTSFYSLCSIYVTMGLTVSNHRIDVLLLTDDI